MWDKKFAVRQEDAHRHEERPLTPDGEETIIEAFLSQFGSRLDPPQYNHTALRNFLEEANEGDLKLNPIPTQHNQTNILLDDRRDDTGWQDIANVRHFARDWNSYAGGYPPEGENVLSSLMNAGDLYKKRLNSVIGVLRIHRL